MNHGYSIEPLYHYTCGACRKWWSVADDNLEDGEEITCPKCRTKAPAYRLPSFCPPGLEDEAGI